MNEDDDLNGAKLDIMPHNLFERSLACLCMLAYGMMWTYAIGTVATIASTLDPHGLHYTQTMVHPPRTLGAPPLWVATLGGHESCLL